MSKITEQKWQKMVQAFRESPGNIKNAAREALVDRSTARKAWSMGYPTMNRKPIQQIVQQEQDDRAALARARADAVKTETEAFAAALRGEVRSNALEEYERTNQYLRAAAMTATSTLVAVHRMQPVVQELGALAPRLLETIHREIVQGEFSATQAMGLLERVASFTKAVAATANSATLQGAKVVEISMARNKVENIIDIKGAAQSEPFDVEEARRLAAELAEAALEVSQEGAPQLSVVEGGAAG